MVPGVGLEPTRISPADFKSAASAYSATPASNRCYFTAFAKEVQLDWSTNPLVHVKNRPIFDYRGNSKRRYDFGKRNGTERNGLLFIEG